jgi:glycosyltransferase involved in cell wall biosynthesis
MALHLLKNNSYDIYHVHMLATPALVALWIGKLLRKPVLIKSAGAGPTGDIGTSKKLIRGQMKLKLVKNHIQKLVCPSEESLNEFKLLGVPEDKLRLIPNGVDTQRFHPASTAEQNQARSVFALNPNRKVAVYAGRWVEGKGVEKILAAWRRGRESQEFQWDLLLLLVDAQKTVRAHELLWRPLGDSVHIFHDVADPLLHYHASDLAILLSDAEGLSNFLIEAMACGLPSLTTLGAAVSKQTDRTAWSWNAETAPDASARLLQLQNEPAALRSKGEAARSKAEESFAIKRVAESYETMYREMQAKG